MTEVERGRRPPAEPDDIDHAIACCPRLAQMIVRLVYPGQLAETEDPSRNLSDEIEPGADALKVEIVGARVLVVGLVEPEHVRVRVLRILVVFGSVPRTIECKERHRLFLYRPG